MRLWRKKAVARLPDLFLTQKDIDRLNKYYQSRHISTSDYVAVMLFNIMENMTEKQQEDVFSDHIVREYKNAKRIGGWAVPWLREGSNDMSSCRMDSD